MDKLDNLFKKLGLNFKRKDFIEQAFFHRSYLNENKKIKSSNERLEFLGDSVLSLIVSQYLYLKFPQFSEGELTNLRSAVVKTKTLADIARELKLGDYLFLSKGEEDGGGRENPSLLADTFEAFLGVVFIDLGLAAAKKILDKYLFTLIPKILQNKLYKDAKSLFQEIVQEETKISPQYKVLKEDGPDHAKEFTIGVYVDETLWGTGAGKNKQEGETRAAQAALEKWSRR